MATPYGLAFSHMAALEGSYPLHGSIGLKAQVSQATRKKPQDPLGCSLGSYIASFTLFCGSKPSQTHIYVRGGDTDTTSPAGGGVQSHCI